MKKIISLTIFLFTFCNFYAQDYDLIITVKGDSLACHIDSITDSYIYIEMMHNNNWIHTFFNKNHVAEYKRNTIERRLYNFKPGTSYILSKRKKIVKDYDLVVTKKGDSLACRIDSITDSHIYFKMIHNNKWIHTLFKKDQVAETKLNAVERRLYNFKPGTSYILSKRKKIVKGYYHAHRLMFAPTSHSLKEGDAYYNTHCAMIHSLQYGFTDNISIDFGTTIIALPFYAMFNASFPVSNNFAFTVGDIVVFNIIEEPGILGNMAYGLVSIGNPEKNLNIGAGYMNFSDLFMEKTNTAAFTLSGQIKIGKRAYLLTEHYGTKINSGFWPDYIGNEWKDEYSAQMQDYTYKQLLILGLTGVRFISNRNPLRSCQLGFIHILLIDGNEIPAYFNIPDWENHLDDGKSKFIPIPIISFSWKFSKNYR